MSIILEFGKDEKIKRIERNSYDHKPYYFHGLYTNYRYFRQ